MNTNIKNFDAKNPNFAARLIIFALSVLAMIGVKFPDSPDVIADNVTNALSGGGYFALITVLGISVVMPIVNFIRSKPTGNFKAIILTLIGSPNFWVYLGNFIFGLVILWGVQIPNGTAEQIVGAVYAQDWTGLLLIAVANIFDPIIRYLRDKKNQLAVAS